MTRPVEVYAVDGEAYAVRRAAAPERLVAAAKAARRPSPRRSHWAAGLNLGPDDVAAVEAIAAGTWSTARYCGEEE